MTRLADTPHLHALAAGNYHLEGSLRALQVGMVDRIDDLAAEVATVVEQQPPSIVKVGHVTGWTRPHGEVRQWSLFNRHGDTANTGDDFNYRLAGKTVPVGLPLLADFASGLPDLVNLRLNCLSPGSELSPHEEHLPRPLPQGRVGLRARFHLPIVTNDQATVLADGHRFHFERGKLYCFNNGAVHAARNEGDQHRFHLVFDILMTERAYWVMFEAGNEWIRHEVAEVPIVEVVRVDSWEPSAGMPLDEFRSRQLVFMPA